MQALPDGSTGLMGNFSMANEPSFHIPYLYNLAGQPRKTQKFVRKTLECWFRNDRMGMCGDEDGGGMSAYAVFSMLGFYPFNPCDDGYVFGAPQAEEMRLSLPGGRELTVRAKNLSEKNIYVKSVALNGQKIDAPRLTHEQLLAGGELVFEMCE